MRINCNRISTSESDRRIVANLKSFYETRADNLRYDRITGITSFHRNIISLLDKGPLFAHRNNENYRDHYYYASIEISPLERLVILGDCNPDDKPYELTRKCGRCLASMIVNSIVRKEPNLKYVRDFVDRYQKTMGSRQEMYIDLINNYKWENDSINKYTIHDNSNLLIMEASTPWK